MQQIPTRKPGARPAKQLAPLIFCSTLVRENQSSKPPEQLNRCARSIEPRAFYLKKISRGGIK
jgi:hypothetical protein